MQLIGGEVERPLDRIVDVHGLSRGRFVARHSQEDLDDSCTALGRDPDPGCPLRFAFPGQRALQECGLPEHDLQGVVELVGDAGEQHAEGRELLALVQCLALALKLLLGGGPLGDVREGADDRAIAQLLTVNLDDSAVREGVLVYLPRQGPVGSEAALEQGLGIDAVILARKVETVVQPVADQLRDMGSGLSELSRVADDLMQPVVGEDDTQIGVEHHYPLGDVREHHLEMAGSLGEGLLQARLLVAEHLFDKFAVGDVSPHRDEATGFEALLADQIPTAAWPAVLVQRDGVDAPAVDESVDPLLDVVGPQGRIGNVAVLHVLPHQLPHLRAVNLLLAG